jgi:hypothetical protein
VCFDVDHIGTTETRFIQMLTYLGRSESETDTQTAWMPGHVPNSIRRSIVCSLKKNVFK